MVGILAICGNEPTDDLRVVNMLAGLGLETYTSTGENHLTVPTGARTVWGIDVSVDRSHSWIAAAVFDANGNPPIMALNDWR